MITAKYVEDNNASSYSLGMKLIIIYRTVVVFMSRVEHFAALGTNIDNLYKSIKKEIQKEKNLKIVRSKVK